MNTTQLKTGLALAFGLITVPVYATDINFNGFASFVAGQTLEDDEGTLYDYDDKMGFQESSQFGLQMRADLQDKLSATAQIVAKGSNDYDAKFNWAYLQYEFNDEWSAKVGRSRNPLFMYSDFLDVGYAYHWITPPGGVYSLGGLDSTDGINISYQTSLGDIVSKATLVGGRINTGSEVSGASTEIEISNQWVFAWSLNYDWFTARVVYSESELTVAPDGFDAVTGALEDLGVSPEDIDNFISQDDKTIFSGIGFSIDYDAFLLVSEFTKIDIADSYLFETSEQWYVSGGYRFGDFMVYLTYEEQEQDYDQDTLTPLLTAVDGALGTTVSADPFVQGSYLKGLGDLREGIQATMLNATVETQTASIGLRYNFHPAACFKVEYLQQKVEASTEGDRDPSAIAMAIDIIY